LQLARSHLCVSHFLIIIFEPWISNQCYLCFNDDVLYHVDGGGSCGVMGEMAHACDNKGGEEKTHNTYHGRDLTSNQHYDPYNLCNVMI
jgi:hypothetical protein